jgi:hypothetical protein
MPWWDVDEQSMYLASTHSFEMLADLLDVP